VHGLLVPRRRRGYEILDDPRVDPRLERRSLHDVARSNFLFGGTRAVLAELRRTLREYRRLPDSQRELTLLDVGTGIGDIPSRAQHAAANLGIRLTTIGLDESHALAVDSRSRTSEAICGNALALPVPDTSIDIVTCSQVLHHFTDTEARRVIREMHRVARLRVIVSDIRRSWLAAGGIWLASFPLGFHPVSRHDGVVSVMRGFTAAELAATIGGAIGFAPTVRHRIGFRITASWNPGSR
jgi:2-polyprenyl-3-methyl-5-hydroxy-6-metoxy-1,4-benzoquinol methylase